MKLHVPEHEIEFDFTRASGPGGQHVNRVQTAVQLRFNVDNSKALNNNVKKRLRKLAGKRMTNDGILLIEAQSHRSQARNKAEALERFQELLDKASVKLKKRRPTGPTQASKERRLQSKKARGQVKRLRGSVDGT